MHWKRPKAQRIHYDYDMAHEGILAAGSMAEHLGNGIVSFAGEKYPKHPFLGIRIHTGKTDRSKGLDPSKFPLARPRLHLVSDPALYFPETGPRGYSAFPHFDSLGNRTWKPIYHLHHA
ncbi:uncharacterized protein BO97DRAFT_17255 [Aspergillus homomorphus CBS 101889]|uniref:Uncharacterized protein n=1 Tax=Aspergillus homomorphus (strain CBS 101889) TaxID=1450537 RepID=A0A395I4A5_ASPHC|nr:hypothetical protein BO97DRAFT_17255 [Aspergillus homomorphus CBS 101889]RAL14018.1 hypothetical protein BO97DRAFT_17255 [Aspergillus homomorphus CBS 101889]